MNQITLGSLFDGSGGFTLGAIESGIIPVWASEIEPFPIRVTTRRMPHVKHYGDICQIRGDEIEPVNIITFGSPCQDMSIAGRRDGLNGNRSSLFYEAIRVIKEMREKTNGQKPRYIIWENVTGAFSSNKGEDYRRVLEEIAKIKGSELSIPKSDGKWRKAGVIMGDNLSIAWRTVDAQYWGVPQRRKRIYLIADFAGQSAGEILFEQESMRRDFDKSRKTKKRNTTGIKSDIGKTSKIANRKTYSINKNLHHTKVEEEKTGTIVATDYKCPPIIISRNMTVRKLTPQECGKLQGFPENWCSDLETIEPNEKDLVFWRDIFKTHGKISGKIKDKTDKQIVKWLKKPHSDSAEYKMWGNGVALPNVKFVLSSIKTYIEFRKDKL